VEFWRYRLIPIQAPLSLGVKMAKSMQSRGIPTELSLVRRWQVGGCFDIIFTVVVLRLHQSSLLDVTIMHRDGTTTAAKKGGDNIGFNGHKKIKGDKVVAFCDRKCNVIAPFVPAPGNHSEAPLLRGALPNVMRIGRSVGELQGTIVSLDGGYDCRQNRLLVDFLAEQIISIPGIEPPSRQR
jgi:hypothetical protein